MQRIVNALKWLISLFAGGIRNARCCMFCKHQEHGICKARNKAVAGFQTCWKYE